MDELFCALVASLHFKWMPGMLGIDPAGRRLRAYLGDHNTLFFRVEGGAWWSMMGAELLRLKPDLGDPATIGWLAKLARTAWGDDSLCCVQFQAVSDLWAVATPKTRRHSRFSPSDACSGPTEGEAWAAAILAAPVEVDDG